jgi:hypothetical protein
MNIDIFSKPVTLNFMRGQEKNRTKLGYFLTISFTAFVILCGLYFARDIIEKKAPLVL